MLPAQRFLAADFLASSLVLSSLAEAGESRDGAWWRGLSVSDKLAYIAGFFDGLTYAEGVFDGAALLAQEDPNTKKWSPERGKIASDIAQFGFRVISHDFANTQAGALVVGLDHIYNDYRNVRIIVREAMIVVVRSMDGTPDTKIAELLERKRKDAAVGSAR
jgi:hypothetical protein